MCIRDRTRMETVMPDREKDSEYAIKVADVTKVYRLYEKPIDRLKESMSISHKNYHRDFYALNQLSFHVKKGETVGIIGTNGSEMCIRDRYGCKGTNQQENEKDILHLSHSLNEHAAGLPDRIPF